MDFLSFSLVFCFIWFTIQAYFSFFTKKNKLPPGPKPFPIIGNLLDLGDKPHKSLAKLSQTYGPIMSLKLGQVTTIVVSSGNMAKEVLQTHDQFLSNRTIPDALNVCQYSDYALPWIPSTTRWRNLRKICNSHLFSTKVLDSNQNLRHNKVESLLSDVRKSMLVGESVNIGKSAFKTTLSLLSNTILSMDFSDPLVKSADEVKETVWKIMEEVGKPNLADYFPLLRVFDLQGIRRRSEIYFRKMIGIFDRIITQRLQLRYLSGNNVKHNDMLNTLISIVEENSEEMNKTQMERLFVDLFSAGTDTTSSTLEWAMAELMNNPECMSKAQKELEQVSGKGNQVKESDITQLPYLQAVIKETLRLHPAVPLLLPRKAEQDVNICDYIIPKGAQVLVNAWAIGRDSINWENPNSFKPERFLGSNFDVKGRHFELIPFGSGRRICPGLPLAVRMLHFMLGSLIHSFDWKLEDGVLPETMNLDDKFGITLQISQPLCIVPMPRL